MDDHQKDGRGLSWAVLLMSVLSASSSCLYTGMYARARLAKSLSIQYNISLFNSPSLKNIRCSGSISSG